MQYCSLQHQLTSITSHIHKWALFLVWLHLFSFSGFISPLFSSGILGIYWPGSSSFSVISLLFPTVHGVLKARILKWFAIPFSTGPHFVRTLHHDPFVLEWTHYQQSTTISKASLQTKIVEFRHSSWAISNTKMMLLKCCIQYACKFGKLSSGHSTGKVCFYSIPKERQCQRMFKVPHNCTHFTH